MGALALLPFVTTSHLFYGPVSAKFFLVTLLADAVLLTAAYRFAKRREGIHVRGRWLLLALVVALIVQFAAAVFGVFPERSLWSDIFWGSGVLFLAHLGFLAWAMAELLTERDWTLIRRAIAFSAGAFGILSLVGVAGLGATGKWLWIDLGQTGLSFGNETYAGTYLLLAFILGAVEFTRTREWGRGRIALLVALALIALSPLMFNSGLFLGRVSPGSILGNPAIILGLARASSATLLIFLAFLAGYGLLKRFTPPVLRNKLTIAWGGVFLVAVSIGVGMLFVPGSAVQDAYIGESSAARVIVWDSGTAAIAERPFLGWGPENFNFALERNFDPRLFQEENLAEIWFDRAHNIFIDTLVGSGVVGLASSTLLLVAYLIVVYRARRRDLIGDTETMLLIAFVPVHLLQLQTGFNTIGSYTLEAVIGGYALWLERRLISGAAASSLVSRRAISAGLLVLALGSMSVVVFGEYMRQAALVETFHGKTLVEQQANIEKSLARVSSFESLRLSSASFIKGSLAVIAEESTPERRKNILIIAHDYEVHYQRYLEEQPNHYRAHINYAYMLLVMTTLGENRVEDAKREIARGYELSPGNPLTYILDALAELYRGNLKESKRIMAEARAINPDIEFTQEAEAYFTRQWEQFPNITVLKLTNL